MVLKFDREKCFFAGDSLLLREKDHWKIYGIIYDFDLDWILGFFGQPVAEVPLGRRRADDPEPRLRVRPSRRQRHVPTSLRLARLTH